MYRPLITLIFLSLFLSIGSISTAQNCTAPVNGGTLVPSSTSICSYQYFGISVSGASTGTGISYQWEESADGTAWQVMPSFTGATLSKTISVSTYFRRKTSCNTDFAYSNAVQIIAKSFNDCYCTPTTATCASGHSITNVAFSTVNNSSTCGTNGYSNFTTSVAAGNVMRGTYMPLSVSVATASSSKFVQVAIDYNQDGDFSSKERTLLFSPVGNTYSGSIRTPFNARLGVTRMRLIYNSSGSSSCFQENTSETEDYSINFTANTTGATGHVIHVKTTGGGNGSSWTNALNSVRNAVALAWPGDTIKVAAGTYYGASQTNGIQLTDSITLLGGFPATGTPTNAERNHATNPTILSGLPNSSSTNGDYHVLYGSGNISLCVIDGFIIQSGGNYYGTGMQEMGGGILIDNGANITIKNTVFRYNHQYSNGSSIAVYNGKGNFINCIITQNHAYHSNILIQKNSTVNFTNLLAASNTGEILLKVDSSQVNFTNSTIAANALNTCLATAANLSQVNFTNSISYYNSIYNPSWQSLSYDSTEIRLDASTASFNYSLTQITNAGNNLILGAHPKFRDTSNVAGGDGFYFTADDGYSLMNPCSPALNAGSNAAAAAIGTDILGQPRIFGVVDLGPYEIQQARGAVPTVLYVNATATGANNGSSWANAFTDLHKALQACSDTIKVAGGSYFPWKAAGSEKYYWLENKRVMLGSFPPTGNPTNGDRNYESFPSIIDGLMNNGETAITVVRGQNLDSTSLFDGFRIFNTGTEQWTSEAAMVYSACNNPVVSNCSFKGNKRRIFWGKNNKNPLLLNLKVFENNAYNNSYGLDMFVFTNSEKTTIRKALFTNNQMTDYTGISGEHGRMLILENTDALLDSCEFIRNRATVIQNVNCDPTITNSRFVANWAGERTVDMENYFSNPLVTNSYFRDSMWNYFQSTYGGHLFNYVSHPVFKDCQFYGGESYRGGAVAYNDSSDAKFINCVFSVPGNAFYNVKGSDMELTNCISVGPKFPGGTSAFMYNSYSSPIITNTVVTKSGAGTTGIMFNDPGSFPKINNSIFWKNFSTGTALPINANDRVEIKNNGNAMPVIHNSMFELYDAGTANNNTRNTDPRFANYRDPIGPDSIWFTADDGLRLCDCSPAINSGNNNLNLSTQDLTNQPRVIGGDIDRGAYELQTTPQPTINTAFVSASATGTNNGSSWNNAYTDLQKAFGNPCVDSIKVAAGTYKTTQTTKRDTGFLVDRSLVILGSYTPNTELRDVDATPSILSGDIGNPNDSSDNSFGIIKAFYVDTLILDGLVIADANRSGYYGNFAGGVQTLLLQYLQVKDCRIRNNTAHNNQGGGLMVTNAKNFDIRKTVFTNNLSAYGGGLFADNNVGSKKITDCVFEGNISTWQGGGVLAGENGLAFVNCVFTHNKARQGGAMLVDNNVDVLVENCTFNSNLLTPGGSYGAGIYSTGASWQGGGAGPYIRNCIFTENTFEALAGTGQQYQWHDLYYPKNGYHPYDDVELRIHHSAVTTHPEYYWGGGLIGPSQITYKNKLNPRGPDGKWFTADDGLQLSVCSGGINNASNAAVTSDKDVAGNPRIFNTTVDMGAYEFNGSPIWTGVLNHPNDSVAANKEITDTLGWTHYYKDCFYLMSIKKAGQQIGTIGDGTFELKIVTGPNYGSGTAMNLTAAAYNVSGQPWYVMNRYWKVKATNPVQDSMLVRFPYSNTDFNDVKGSNPSVTQHQQMEFFKVSGTDYPFDLNIAPANFRRYANGAAPTLNTWTYTSQDSIHLSEFFVNSFSGGGGGAHYSGGLPDLSITTSGVSPASATGGSTVTASFIESNLSSNGMAGNHSVWFYLSNDNQLTPGSNTDTLIGKYTLGQLSPLANTGTLTRQLIIPCDRTAGNQFLFIVSDGANGIAESNENNNQVSLPIHITAGISAPATPLITVGAGAHCYGNTITLTASSAGCVGCVFTWSTGATGATINVTTSGTYTVTATNNCGSVSASQVMTFNSGPDVNLSGPNGSCLGNTFTLNATGADSYTWTGNGLNATTGASVTATPTISGTVSYTVIGTTNGCTTSRTVNINVYPRPVMNITPADATICTGGSVTMTVSGTAEGVIWSPATGLNVTQGWTVIASPATTTTYKIVGSSIFGCKDSTTKTVTVSPPVTPMVTIGYTGCPGNNLTFTATPTNGGTSPTYEWYLNNVKQSSTTNTLPVNNAVNGMQVYAVLTATGCVTQNRDTSNKETVNCIVSSLPSIDALESFSVSPNPTAGPVSVHMKLATAKLVSFTVTDGYGKVIYQSLPVKMTGNITRKIDLQGAAAGIYYLRTQIGIESFVEKVVVVR